MKTTMRVLGAMMLVGLVACGDDFPAAGEEQEVTTGSYATSQAPDAPAVPVAGPVAEATPVTAADGGAPVDADAVTDAKTMVTPPDGWSCWLSPGVLTSACNCSGPEETHDTERLAAVCRQLRGK